MGRTALHPGVTIAPMITPSLQSLPMLPHAMNSAQTPIIIAAYRTPIGRVGRSLRHLTVEQLTAPLLQALLSDTGLDGRDINDVILGNAMGSGGNPARVAALAAGMPMQVSGMTIDRQCGSGLAAINLAARLIQSGAGSAYLAGGVESVSTAPWRIEKPKSLYDQPQFTPRARFAPDAIGDPDMGMMAEQIAQQFGICRDRQDAYAARSHEKAIAAQQSGRFLPEIISIANVTTDECPRQNMTRDRLAKLPPVFMESGSITVGNACPINDGAAVVLMVSEAIARDLGISQGLRFIDSATVGVDPNLAGMGPVAATQALFARQRDRTLADVTQVEFNEAFAAQVLANLDQLQIPETIVNPRGGAIALGHPYGASGAILITRLFTDFIIHTPGLKQLGLATIGVGGGLGISTLLETWQA
jgi:acetyl-CoA C-acetyltransferase